MRIFTYKPPSARRGTAAIEPLAPGISWARFGEDTLMYSDEVPGEPTPPPSRGVRVPSRLEDATREQLHVVVQNGRLFQQLHPDVPVLHDRGRYLLVQLDPKQARKLEKKHHTCYGVMPLKEDHVVFDIPDLARSRAVPPFVGNLVNKAQPVPLEITLKSVAAFPTRHSISASYGEAATLARDLLSQMGYQTRTQSVTVNGKPSRNVIADKPGAGSGARNVVVVTAHLDSINLTGGPSAPAPGADDNASGCAGLLEIARAFKDHRALHDLRLILFGGEEQGLFGSRRYVASLSATERKKIAAVVNMDMIGRLNSPARSVLLEGAPLSKGIIEKLTQAAADFTDLRVETSLSPFASDHVPFINAGIPAVLTIEGVDNTNKDVHSAADKLEKIDFGFALSILRMNIAFVATEIGMPPDL